MNAMDGGKWLCNHVGFRVVGCHGCFFVRVGFVVARLQLGQIILVVLILVAHCAAMLTGMVQEW